MQNDGGKLTAWLRLVRLPNLLTVPGDPLAGYFLAATCCCQDLPAAAVFAVAASLLLYAFGLISNDLFDLREDRLERPDRPLPSGRINPFEAAVAAVILVITALAAAAMNGRISLGIAGILALIIMLYNSAGKRIPVFGPLNMGLCRGFSLLLGASFAGSQGMTCLTVLLAAALLTAYIAAVTFLAAGETMNKKPGSKRWWPVVSIALFLVPFCWNMDTGSMSPTGRMFFVCLVAAALVWTWKCGAFLAGTPGPGVIPAVIGRFIQGLIIIQALLLSVCNWRAQIAAVILLLLLPVFSILAYRFYSS